MKFLRLLPLAGLFLAPLHPAAAADDAKQLATDVWRASGGENWQHVQRIRFTFAVEADGKTLLEAEHDWDVAAGTDHVKWKNKDVTVNVYAPAADEDGKAAYARWVNDSYWLLAPLKLLDRGVTLTAEPAQEIDGARCEVLRLSFAKVGLTPGDEYRLYIDPKSKLVRAWDYMPKPGTKMRATWDGYREFGGLHLATEHQFAGKAVRFPHVEVVAGR